MKIVSAVVTRMTGTMFDFKKPEVIVTFEDGTTKKLFDFYPDEISFRAEEFVGKTEEEGRALFHRKDVAYLRS